MSLASVAINDVPIISKRLKACCRRAKLYCTDEVLLTSPADLVQTLRIDRQDVDLLRLQAASATAPPCISVLDALQGNFKAPIYQDYDDTLQDQDSDSDSATAPASDPADVSRLVPSSTFVPPTQGYDGHFPGLASFTLRSESDYDSDSDSQSDSEAGSHFDIEESHRSSDQIPYQPQDRYDSTLRQPSSSGPDAVPEAEASQHGDILDRESEFPPARDPISFGRPLHLLSSGDVELDRLLSGGFRTSALSEIVGESAAGKTQLAIQTCVFAALDFVGFSESGSNELPQAPAPSDLSQFKKASIRAILAGLGMRPLSREPHQVPLATSFITSDGERGAHSIVRRALELSDHAIRYRFRHRFGQLYLNDSAQVQTELSELQAKVVEMGREQVLNNLHVACVSDVEALQHALKYSLPGLISRIDERRQVPRVTASQLCLPIGLIVIDNLPSLFQEEPVASHIDSLFQRSKTLIDIADTLKRLSLPAYQRPMSYFGSAGSLLQRTRDQIGRAVLVLNHVSDAFAADKEFARQFVFGSASQIHTMRTRPNQLGHHTSSRSTYRLSHASTSALPDYAAALGYTTQSAYFSGLLASVPPTLAETISLSSHLETSSSDAPLYVLSPKTAQLGHTWSNNINMRLFLSKTRGRVSLPVSESADDTRTRLVTVRRAAVVFSAFGPSMQDPVDKHEASSRRTRMEARQLRFVITRENAIHSLAPYIVHKSPSHLASDSTSLPARSEHDLEGSTEAGTQLDEEDEFYNNFPLEDHHLSAMDLDSSCSSTPLG